MSFSFSHFGLIDKQLTFQCAGSRYSSVKKNSKNNKMDNFIDNLSSVHILLNFIDGQDGASVNEGCTMQFP